MSETVLNKTKWDALLAKVGEGLMVRMDSREVREGDIFVAISGPLRDGADFVPQALENGAAYIICDKEIETGAAELVTHPSPREALGDLAMAYFKTADSKICLRFFLCP